ncbi:MAG: hypothetical protein IKN53_04470, partial [Oscillibacter sp.]|nr:hypothetical protein [Oscillibacter sp.]
SIRGSTGGMTAWGGKLAGLTASTDDRYIVTFKIRNVGAHPIAIGAWVPNNPAAFNINNTFYLTSQFNGGVSSANRNTLQSGLIAGTLVRTESVSNANAGKNLTAGTAAMLNTANWDDDGFIEVKFEHLGNAENSANGQTRAYVRIRASGEWMEFIDRGSGAATSGTPRTALPAASNMWFRIAAIDAATDVTIKDVQFWSGNGQHAESAEIVDREKQAKDVTLAEVKPRYGIEKLITADQPVTPTAIFRDRMDAYAAYMDHAQNAGVQLASGFPAVGTSVKDLFVTFRCAIHPTLDTQLQSNLGQIKLQYTTDGVNWTDSGASFTARATGEKTIEAASVSTDANGDYLFNDGAMLPVYEFTSGRIEPAQLAHIRNIRLIPSASAGVTGKFRLLSLYVWGDSGETISVPVLDGNRNPSVKKTTVAGTTSYELYNTNFDNLYGWTTNIVNCLSRRGVSVAGAAHPVAEFSLDGNLPTMDGRQVRLYSPNMSLNADLYDALNVSFRCYRVESDGDPELTAEKLRLGYSTDNGATWTKIDVAPAVTLLPSGGVDGAGCSTYSVSMNLKPYLPSAAVTNIVILPYNDTYWYRLYAYPAGNIDNLVRTNPLLDENPNAGMYGSTGAFRMVDFSITGTSTSASVAAKAVPVYRDDYDSAVLQAMINDAKADWEAKGKKEGGAEVTIPSVNPRDGSHVWIINRTLLIPSNMTVHVNNCTLRMGNYTHCRMLQNEKCPSKTAEQADHDIHILGVGDAVLQGGVFNGIRTELLSGLSNTSLDTWDNMTIALQNVNAFSVKNLRIEQSRFWSLAMYYCSGGCVEHIDLFNNRALYVDGWEVHEQDGIDVRPGTYNVTVNDITGRTGDDSVALVAIRPGNFEVTGADKDIHDITITNVATKLERLRMNLRVTACNGLQIYNVLVDGIYDTAKDFGGKDSRCTVQIGNDATAYVISSEMAAHDIHDLYLRNIKGCTPYVFTVMHENVLDADWAYDYATCENLYEGGAEHGLVAKGSIADPEGVPLTAVDCTHKLDPGDATLTAFTEELSGTMHLKGLNPSAQLLTWRKCANCTAVKCMDELQTDFITSASIDMGEDITFHVYATLTPAQAARVTRMDFTMDTADSNPNKAQSVPLASAT